MPLSVKQCIYAPSGRLSDGRGLYLLTKPSGSKSWVLRVQYAGHRRDFGLGSFAQDPDLTGIAIEKRRLLTLADAREKARIGRQLAKAGISPTEHWRTPIEEPEMPTFETAAKNYHSDAKRSWRNGKHADQWIGTLKAYAFPAIGHLPVDQIDASKIYAERNGLGQI